jgi:hypothetical protein
MIYTKNADDDDAEVENSVATEVNKCFIETIFNIS